MGVSKYQQWKERITSRRLAEAFGMEEAMVNLLMTQRLRWLGHVACMEPTRMPKLLLFGELEKKRPGHGIKRRWRDLVAADIKAVDVSDGWYDLAQDRKAWRALCWDGVMSLIEQHHSGWTSGPARSTSGSADSYPCQCGRSFRRKGDLTRNRQFCSSARVADH